MPTQWLGLGQLVGWFKSPTTPVTAGGQCKGTCSLSPHHRGRIRSISTLFAHTKKDPNLPLLLTLNHVGPGYPQTWQHIFPWLFHDHSSIFDEGLSSRFCIFDILRKMLENTDFLHYSGTQCTNLGQFAGKIGKIPWLITKFHDFWPIFHVTWLFHDHFHFPGFPVSVGTLRLWTHWDRAPPLLSHIKLSPHLFWHSRRLTWRI